MGKIVLVCLLALLQPQDDTLRVMFWNLENFFDYRNDSTSVSDAEFSSLGERRWTRKRFNAKCNAIAKGILWAASAEGGLPDVIGFAEVENAFVLRRLLQGTALRKLDYEIVHFDSPDSRGIDVALLYRRSRLKLEDARPCHLFQADTVMATRDILLCRFSGLSESFAVLVNHHPSKYGGTAVSEPRRRLAVERLRFLADSLSALGENRIIATGDFNDTPANPVYKLLEPTLVPQAVELFSQGRGTIRYDGAWNLIDQFYVSPALLPARMSILYIPFLQVPDATHGGTKPLRTYSGPRYQGGVSDHCPIWLVVPGK
jgi:predicted extracellular nuclease